MGPEIWFFRQVILCGENPVTDTFCDLFELLKMQEVVLLLGGWKKDFMDIVV